MKCFYHPVSEAVGLCKHCSRGVCKDCAAERVGGLACRNIHESEVDRTSALIDRNINLVSRGGSVNLLAALIYWGASAICVFLIYRETIPNLRLMLGVMAAITFLLAINNTRLLISRRLLGNSRNQSSK
jgi:hypothetical protein